MTRKEFRSGKSPILVATDVAARGLGEFLYPGQGSILFSQALMSTDRRWGRAHLTMREECWAHLSFCLALCFTE